MFVAQYNSTRLYETNELDYNDYSTAYETGLLYNEPGMPYGGVLPSLGQTTLCDELNRLANGGTYPPITEYVDFAKAANLWAGTSDLDTVGALNTLAGLPQSQWKALAGVCNVLAGTVGLEAAAALRTIEQ